MQETPLGGNLNDAVRVGDTVRRTTGPWTPAVHALLRFLEEHDFPAPRVRGIDEQGREILEFVEGEAHSGTFEPVPDRVMVDENMLDAARLLRRYHDLAERFRPPSGARWRVVAPTVHEIITHNDWSPWNALLREGRLYMTLDWDLAGPGSRLWGVANAALSWVPLFSGHVRHSLDEKARRLRLFVDAYGLADRDRGELVSTMRLELRHMSGVITDAAARGDVGMQRLVAWGIPKTMYESEVEWLDAHRAALERAL
jgi:aminoglycoside phosphotransferase (APT) family kinase protein